MLGGGGEEMGKVVYYNGKKYSVLVFVIQIDIRVGCCICNLNNYILYISLSLRCN